MLFVDAVCPLLDIRGSLYIATLDFAQLRHLAVISCDFRQDGVIFRQFFIFGREYLSGNHFAICHRHNLHFGSILFRFSIDLATSLVSSSAEGVLSAGGR